MIQRAHVSKKNVAGVFVALLLVATSADALADTYQVGPGKPYANLNEVQDLLQPGDVVEVDGDATYPGDIHFRNHGRPDAPITIRGIPLNRRPPVLSGGDEWTVVLHGDHYVLENFEITGGPEYCVVHKAHDVTIRNTVVHDCPNHGILGTDAESGSLTIEYSEVYACGSGDRKHQLYIATDETMHPGSVFRLQFTFVHGANGGNNVKSRAERNEIYYNWIEGAVYHGLDLIGPDGQEPGLAREDSDVVGNVIVTTSSWQVARFGGDATGSTAGRYRFVNNTFFLGPEASVALRMQEGVESVELHNNVFFKQSDGEVQLLRHTDPMGADPVVRGSNNWIQDGFTDVPAGLSASLRGGNPGFTDPSSFDLRPRAGSTLIDTGTNSTAVKDAHAIPNPLEAPVYVPLYRMRLMAGTQVERPRKGTLDIGAYEEGSPVAPPPDWNTGGSGGGSGGSGGSSQPAKPAASSEDGSGCACHLSSRHGGSAGWLILALGLLATRRRSPHRRG
jgi:hypothetical protein